MNDFKHFTVMKNEAVGALNVQNSDKIFIDATLGGGGHSKLIASSISKNGLLLSFDIDDDAISKAKTVLEEYENVKIIRDSYVNIPLYLEKFGIEKITGGILFDLGASYHQLTEQKRGFSFMKDAPLDMRFDKNADFSAFDVINKYKEGDLVRIFSNYGEERFSKRIAHAVVQNRPVYTTLQLVDIIKSATPKIKTKIHCATRVFQALRIEVNHELDNIENTLNKIIPLLDLGATISVISFHSLEDRIVKNVFKKFASSSWVNNENFACGNSNPMLKLLNKKPILAQDDEIKINPPSRSAKLRTAVRI